MWWSKKAGCRACRPDQKCRHHGGTRYDRARNRHMREDRERRLRTFCDCGQVKSPRSKRCVICTTKRRREADNVRNAQARARRDLERFARAAALGPVDITATGREPGPTTPPAARP